MNSGRCCMETMLRHDDFRLNFCNARDVSGVYFLVTFADGPAQPCETSKASLPSRDRDGPDFWWKSLLIKSLLHFWGLFRLLFDPPKNRVVTSQMIWLRR